MLSRRITRRERPLLLPPPLDRVPLRLGNVVEIVGPSPSSKTHLLIQVLHCYCCCRRFCLFLFPLISLFYFPKLHNWGIIFVLFQLKTYFFNNLIEAQTNLAKFPQGWIKKYCFFLSGTDSELMILFTLFVLRIRITQVFPSVTCRIPQSRQQILFAIFSTYLIIILPHVWLAYGREPWLHIPNLSSLFTTRFRRPHVYVLTVNQNTICLNTSHHP